MIRLVPALLLVLFASFAWAFSLEAALARADQRPDVVNARLELNDAESALERVRRDPLALRLDLLQAEQAVALGRAQWRAARHGALREMAQAYTGAVAAREQLALAEAAAALQATALDIARIRLANGSATRLDVQDAEVAYAEAEANAQAAEQGLAVALANLSGMVGEEVAAASLEQVPEALLPALPPVDDALAAVVDHPQSLQVAQGLELAAVALELLDPSYAAPVQIQEARTRLATTRELAREAERGLALQVRNLFVQAESAAESYRVARDALSAAEERLGSERQRFEAGLIAAVQLRQAELQAQQAALALLQARHGYLSALLALQEGAALPIVGPAPEPGATDED